MTDMTKAVPSGWIAPSYDENGKRFRDEDIRVSSFNSEGFGTIENNRDAFDLDVDQAKALIDALQRAVAEYEERL